MKLFSAFDSNFKYEELADAQEQYGEDKAFIVTKSKAYLWVGFLIPGFIIGIIWLIILILAGIYMTLADWFLTVAIIDTVFLGVWIIYTIYKCYVRYKLDFLLVSPEKIDIYNQINFVHRSIKSIFYHEVSWVYVDKDWFFDSVLNNGFITIESEENQHKSLRFWPIYDPDHIKKHIENLVKKDFEKFSK